MKDIDSIVIGGDHYNPLWVTRALGRAHFNVATIIIKEGKKKSFAAESRYATWSKVYNSYEDMLDFLLSFNTSKKILLISSSDSVTKFLDEHYNELEPKYFLSNCEKKQGKISYWLNKKNMIDAAKKSGFNVPWSKEIRFDLPFEEIGEVIYPCILKPIDGSIGLKTEVRVCNTERELREAYGEIGKIRYNAILQEFLKPDYEFCVVGLRHRDTNTNLLPAKMVKIETCKSTHDMGMIANSKITPSLEPEIKIETIKRFAELIDFDGMYGIDALVHNGKTYFLESNLRVDGTQYMYLAAGINLPAIWLSLIKNDINNAKKYGLYKQPKSIRAITEISYLRYCNKINIIKILKDWSSADAFSLLAKDDLRPVIYKFVYALI